MTYDKAEVVAWSKGAWPQARAVVTLKVIESNYPVRKGAQYVIFGREYVVGQKLLVNIGANGRPVSAHTLGAAK